MILCITPNPAIEHTWVVPSFRLGTSQHVQDTLILPSGKGVNTARAIRTLGGNSFCTGFLGGFTGKRLNKYLQQLKIPAKWTWIERETRSTIAVIDPKNPEQDATLVSEPGPIVTTEDWRRLTADVLSVNSKFATISGRIPYGAALIEFQNMIRSLEKRGTNVWIDTSGKGLKKALTAIPSGLKINTLEASTVVNKDVTDFDSAFSAAQILLDRKIKNVVITMGKLGAVLVNQEGAWYAESPTVEAVSSVGSGDAFQAGLLIGISQKRPNSESLRMAIAAGAANTLSLGGGSFKMDDYLGMFQKVRVRQVS